LMLVQKKIADAVNDVELELTDIDRRLAELRHKHEAALLADSTKELDVIEVTQGRLEKAARRAQERLKLLQRQEQEEQEAALQKQLQEIQEQFCKILEEADSVGVELQQALGHVLTLYRKEIELRERARSFVPAGVNSHVDASTNSVEGAGLAGSAVSVWVANELFRISTVPFLGGRPGEIRVQPLPGAQCPDLRLQGTPEKIEPLADRIKRASKFAIETFATLGSIPIRALTPGQAIAPAEGSPRTDAESRHVNLLKQLDEASRDVSPAGEARYMELAAELTRLSNEQPGAPS
jgi:hypothetical protein